MGDTKSILIVDDEPNACAYLKDLLDYFGYQVSCALTAKEAIQMLRERSFDCVLLDVYLRHESGEGVLRWLRTMGRAEPVVMMCTMPHFEMRVDLMFKGASDLIGKPVQPTQLRQVVRKVMDPSERPQAPGAPYPGASPLYLRELRGA